MYNESEKMSSTGGRRQRQMKFVDEHVEASEKPGARRRRKPLTCDKRGESGRGRVVAKRRSARKHQQRKRLRVARCCIKRALCSCKHHLRAPSSEGQTATTTTDAAYRRIDGFRAHAGADDGAAS